MEKLFDVIVLGVGSMGSATCYELAKRGYRVLGIEQFAIPHDLGSHGGQSRIIRKAYFEHPDYVPLLQRAYTNWGRLQKETGKQVYFKTGLLYSGPSDHPVISGVKEAASLHAIAINNIPAGNYPSFNMAGDREMLFEQDAGFLLPGKAIQLFVSEAVKSGAVIQSNEKTLSWEKDNSVLKVTTDKAVYRANKLIITTGAWTAEMSQTLSVSLKVTRQLLVWVKPKQPGQYSLYKFPCWMIATPKREGVYYGFPYLDDQKFGEPAGLKLAFHYPGKETNPDHVNRDVSPAEVSEVINGLKEYLPVAGSEVTAVKTCLYTNSPDEHFIIDHLPGYGTDVTIACGFSGHGFKFVSVIGEVLADMAMDGKTKLPVDFLRLSRFS